VTREARLSAAGFVWLALFAVLYTIGAKRNLWPVAPEGFAHDLDPWTGLAFGVALLAALAAGLPREVL